MKHAVLALLILLAAAFWSAGVWIVYNGTEHNAHEDAAWMLVGGALVSFWSAVLWADRNDE